MQTHFCSVNDRQVEDWNVNRRYDPLQLCLKMWQLCSSLFIISESLGCPVFSLHIRKHKWGYFGREYMLWAVALPFSYLPFHTIFSFFSKNKIKILSFFFDLKGERERIYYAAKTEKATHFINLSLSKGAKEEKCMVCFLPDLPPRPSISPWLIPCCARQPPP